MNRLQAVHALGQSIWFDFISRELLSSGRLRLLIDEDALTGLTSNPAIFEKAIGAGNDYDAQLRTLVEAGTHEPAERFGRLAITDTRAAAISLRNVVG